MYWLPDQFNKQLKKPSMAFATSPSEKRGFRMDPIFNGLKPLKMAVHPCTPQPVENQSFSTSC